MSELRNINENSLIEVFSDGKKIGECIGSEFTRNLYSQNKIELFGFAPIELNENQQVVLEWLKKMNRVSAMVTVFCLVDDNINDNWQEYDEVIPPHVEALQKLNIAEENQVLQVFSAWVIEQEGENNE